MANKLFLVCATLAICFLLTNASIYRTVVEMDEDAETDPMRPMQKCRKEFQQEQHLRACQKWIRRRMRQSPFALDDDEFDFEDDDTENRPPLLQRCCNELKQEDKYCVCPTLKQAARAISLQGQHGPWQTRKIYKTAKRLPNVCNIPQVGVCPFKTRPFDLPEY